MPSENTGRFCFKIQPRMTLYTWIIKMCHAYVFAAWRQCLVAATPEKARPVWCMLYKLPITKKTCNLQWWLLHEALATGTFVCYLDPVGLAACPFCKEEEETSFHAFLNYPQL